MLGQPTKSSEIVSSNQKLGLDCRRVFRLRPVMDADTKNLIAELGTRADMAIEDCCDQALSLGTLSDEALPEAIAAIEAAIARMAAFVTAAQKLLN